MLKDFFPLVKEVQLSHAVWSIIMSDMNCMLLIAESCAYLIYLTTIIFSSMFAQFCCAAYDIHTLQTYLIKIYVIFPPWKPQLPLKVELHCLLEMVLFAVLRDHANDLCSASDHCAPKDPSFLTPSTILFTFGQCPLLWLCSRLSTKLA